MIVLAYLWVLALIPFLIEKDDREVQWHSKHGLVLTAAEAILWFALWVLAQIPAVGCLLLPVFMILWLVLLGFRVVLIVKALNGERVLVPGVSHYADQL